jgi:hypothetical protein
MEDNDYVMRQVRQFADGLSYIMGGKNKNKTEIIFEQDQANDNRIVRDIKNKIAHLEYEEALHRFYEQKWSLTELEYHKLGLWLLGEFKKNKVNDQLISELEQKLQLNQES